LAQSGLILVNKPQGFTSHDVVAKVRKAVGTRNVGHAGTLDPMATGLLVLGIESGTKLLTFIVGADKTYEATIRLGARTVTDDAEGELVKQVDASSITDDQIRTEILKLTGKISQRPSSVSAIKVNGVRAYDQVRAGVEVELKSREVEVIRFDLVGETTRDAGFVDLDVIVDCSSGTYIRALARDVGASLGVGGHLTALSRTRVGEFQVGDAVSLEQLSEGDYEIISLLEAAKTVLPTLEITEQQAIDFRNGKRLPGSVAVLTGVYSGTDFVAVVEAAESNLLKSVSVFPKENHG
jgi:tRNA pseudouridine55 synthase